MRVVGRGIRRLVRERHGDLPLQRLGDEIAHLIDRSGRDDDLGGSARCPAGELREQSGEQIGVADPRDRAGELKPRQQRGCLARGELGRALEPDRVGDDDDVALIEQLPVDVEQLVRHLPVAGVAREPDDGEPLDHRAHLVGGDVELVSGLGDRHLALADEVRHELEHERGAIGRDERAAAGHDAPAACRSRAFWSRATTSRGELGRLHHAHLGPVGGELVGEDVHVDVRHPDALLCGRRSPAQAQRRLGARVDLEQGGVARCDILQSRESPVPGAVAQARGRRSAA